MKTIFLSALFLIGSIYSFAQRTKNYIKLEFEGTEFHILVRGNASSQKLLLFIQGGPGEYAIDFARSDYPKWKKGLEKEVLIAYVDQRGLHQKLKQIDSSKITYKQYSRDIFHIACQLKERYEAKVYLMGHSAGGYFVEHCLATTQKSETCVDGAIIINTPLTNDFSPERYQYYRPLYLKNLAKEKISSKEDISYWQEALDWIEDIDSISNPEDAKKWNNYVESAFKPKKGRSGILDFFRVTFHPPYDPFSYWNRKSREKVADILWANSKALDFKTLLPHIQQPILFVSGRYDDIAGPEEMKAATDLAPKGSYEIIPNAGHECFLDQPEVFRKLILAFIKA